MPELIVERDGPVMILTMNRPARLNALNAEVLVRLYDAWREGSADPDVRCFILTGAGGNFSSGADLKEMSAGYGEPRDEWSRRTRQDPDLAFKALLRTYRPTKPILAAVEGVAIAGGTEILQGTEIRVAGESARFGVSEVRWSLYPMGGSAVRLRRQIPYTHAAEILLTGKHLSAREALAIGLVGHVVPDGQALARTREIANALCENGPLAVEAVLKTLHKTDGMSEPEAFALDFEVGQAVFATNDAREGPRAFTEKRRPRFTRS